MGSPSIDFDNEWDQAVYAEWLRDLIKRVFGRSMELHDALYEMSHTHRLEHGEDRCKVWPSPPTTAPMLYLLASLVDARRFLDVGSGIGYTAAVMADAGGTDTHVDTIEIDPIHADIAEEELASRGLADRVDVLRGEAGEILPTLDAPYDIVFVDGGDPDAAQLNRLTRQGGLLIEGESKNMIFPEAEAILAPLKRSLGQEADPSDEAASQAEAAFQSAADKIMRAAQVGG